MTTYEIRLKTGDRKGSGTDANEEIVLLDGSGRQTKPAFLDNWLRNDFKANKFDVFTINDDTYIYLYSYRNRDTKRSGRVVLGMLKR